MKRKPSSLTPFHVNLHSSNLPRMSDHTLLKGFPFEGGHIVWVPIVWEDAAPAPNQPKSYRMHRDKQGLGTTPKLALFQLLPKSNSLTEPTAWLLLMPQSPLGWPSKIVSNKGKKVLRRQAFLSQ